MEIESAKSIYFSPTRTTQKVLEEIVRGLEVERVEHLDLTLPQAGMRPLDEMHDEMALLGAPAVVVVVYGNRAYEDALLELRDLAVEAGFVPVAGGDCHTKPRGHWRSLPTLLGAVHGAISFLRPPADGMFGAVIGAVTGVQSHEFQLCILDFVVQAVYTGS